MMLPLQIAFIFEQTLHSWIQTTLNEAGVVEPTVRDNVESGGYNKSFHNIESFQTFRHYIMYTCYCMGEGFSHKMMSSRQHSRCCTVNILVRAAQRPPLMCVSITAPNVPWLHKQSHKFITYTWGYFSLSPHETSKSYCIFYTLTSDHFLVGSEQESGTMTIFVMSATECSFLKYHQPHVRRPDTTTPFTLISYTW